MPITRPTKSINEIPFSVLDLAPIVQGGNPSQSFQHSIELAQLTEKLGYKRYWLAEHHNMPGIASSATSLVIGHVAAHTSTIRVGSGGIMLPNHSPLVIAEQFGTLEAMFPGRIDLGLGRAPGTDQRTAHALRGANYTNGDEFPEQLEQLQAYFQGSGPVRAIPGEGANIPIWLLGSSGFSARLSAQLGMPFAFASHFSPDNTLPALKLYYENFQPSEEYKEPYAMVAVNIIAADTDEEAEFLSTSIKQNFLNMMRNTPSQLQPPVNNLDELMSPYEKAVLEKQLRSTIIGNPTTVKKKLESFLDETKADEIMVSTMVYDQNARLYSHQLVAEIMGL
ncbi:LLM class flavin-dependent oxidoreductase [Mesobacillus maritimus]|uniref:LLM class flavin-dependent oxidoreductase n=1 Tax=Mesobacillus maritimus TaxID=1643336 RepID=UPI00203E7933|nr:LLM class flavin-dependent oxidoreductase [Mesobacillus maritimus]MCM3584965.1 LLM class flavin-dependent oxidoreductase [Mesobacillus maritimus]